jgi:hypothetical protein
MKTCETTNLEPKVRVVEQVHLYTSFLRGFVKIFVFGHNLKNFFEN